MNQLKVSRYCQIVKGRPLPTLYSLLRENEVTIDEELFKALRQRNFTQMDAGLKNELTALGVLVAQDCNEKAAAVDFMESAVQRSETFEATISLTYGCNVSCSYCVQQEMKQDATFGEEKLASRLVDLAAQRNAKTLQVCFFGGEPLLKAITISNLAMRFRDKCAERGLAFTFSITTNGTLLQPQVVKEWKGLGLSFIEVSLDGDRKNHDVVRKMKAGGSAFDAIMANLDKVAQVIPIVLLCNVSSNPDPLKALFIYLKGREPSLPIWKIRLKPIFPRGENKVRGSASPMAQIPNLWAEAEKLSLPVDRTYALGPCGYFQSGSVAVSPEGKFYPCTPFFGNPKFCLGDANETGEVVKRNKVTDNLPQMCGDCPYLPICGGGCRFLSYSNAGDASNPTCERETFFGALLSPL